MSNLYVRVHAKAHNGHLAKLVDKYGSQEKAAIALGIKPRAFAYLINFKALPIVKDDMIRHRKEGPHKFVGVEVPNDFKQIIKEECGVSFNTVFPDLPEDVFKSLARHRVYDRQMSLLELENLEEAARLEYSPPIDPLESEELKQRIQEVLKTLPRREREILELRFGLNDSIGYTLEKIAHIYRITREQVRRIEAKAIRKLQNPDRNQSLLEFVDLDLDLDNDDRSPPSGL